MMEYILYLETTDPENDMKINCDSAAEMARMAARAILQGYEVVRAEQGERE